MHQAEQRRGAGDREREGACDEPAIEQRGDRGPPHHGREDEAVAKQEQRVPRRRRVPGEIGGALPQAREEATPLDQDHRGGHRQERDRDGRSVMPWRRVERLRRDLEPDEHEDRRDGRLWKDGDEQ